jgi:hypothetical protein
MMMVKTVINNMFYSVARLVEFAFVSESVQLFQQQFLFSANSRDADGSNV